jgi:hypothetical protein
MAACASRFEHGMQRTLAGAFLLGTVLVLAIDVLMHGALAATRVSEGSAPWWVNARVFERTAWVVMAVILWIAAPAINLGANSDGPDGRRSSRAAARTVGVGMIAVPIAWLIASSLVTIGRIAWRQTWSADTRIFFEPYYYSNIVITNAPWILAGAVLLAVSRHVAD